MGNIGLTVSTAQIHDLQAALDEHTMVGISDPQGIFIHVNDRFCAVSHYSRKELVGQNERRFNRGLAKFTADIWNPPGQGTVWKGEITNRAKDGTLYRTETTIVPFFEADGKPRQCVTISVEIAGPSREVNLTLLDDFPALIWRANTEAKCDYFNRSWLEFTGRRLEQETGDGWAEGVHPEDLKGCLEHFLKAFHARQPFVIEYRLRRADGKYRWILDCGRPINDPTGNFTGYIGSCMDISTIRSSLERLPHQRLSDREKQILFLLPSGKSLKEIAGDLGISIQTVSTHRMRILKKLELRTTAGLIRYVLKHGLMT